MALHVLKRRFGVVLAIGAAAVGACRADGSGGAADKKAAALSSAGTAIPSGGQSPTGTTAAKEQALAEAFARQAAVYAQVAATDRAEASALSTAIATEQQQLATKSATATVATSATSVAGGTLATGAGVPAAATTFETSREKAAALADRLGANAQALASFHLAQANQLLGVAAEGGAQ